MNFVLYLFRDDVVVSLKCIDQVDAEFIMCLNNDFENPPDKHQVVRSA